VLASSTLTVRYPSIVGVGCYEAKQTRGRSCAPQSAHSCTVVDRRRAVLAGHGHAVGGASGGVSRTRLLCSMLLAVLVGGWRVSCDDLERGNLFRPGALAAPSTELAYEAKLAGLAALISAQDPDVISLQEIGDLDALSDLIDAVGGSWHQRVSAHPDARGIRVAWLSKPQITASTQVVDFPLSLPAVTADDSGTTLQQMGRGAVAITITARGSAAAVGHHPLEVEAAHLSRRPFPAAR
jgi:Endonuclease/Exonuclease/phosphatase family